MKKLKLSFEDLQCDEVLTREQLKKVLGGGGCGVKVDGVWHPSGVGASATQGFLGTNVTGYDSNNWNYPGSMVVYPGGSYSGFVTNWCCDSCPWNQPASV